MITAELLQIMAALFPGGNWPKPFHVLQATHLVAQGPPLADAARQVGTTKRRLEEVLSSGDPIRELVGVGLREVAVANRERSALMLGGLLLGRCAEIAFEQIYTSEMETDEFELKDLREGRTDTDYRLYNGYGRPVYRINIKFHGAQFRRARELVGLEPEDLSLIHI